MIDRDELLVSILKSLDKDSTARKIIEDALEEQDYEYDEEEFEYDGIRLMHVEQHNDRCDGCYFWNENISCIPGEIPECKTGIFIKVE